MHVQPRFGSLFVIQSKNDDGDGVATAINKMDETYKARTKKDGEGEWLPRPWVISQPYEDNHFNVWQPILMICEDKYDTDVVKGLKKAQEEVHSGSADTEMLKWTQVTDVPINHEVWKSLTSKLNDIQTKVIGTQNIELIR